MFFPVTGKQKILSESEEWKKETIRALELQ
jgi:hypothetical protein